MTIEGAPADMPVWRPDRTRLFTTHGAPLATVAPPPATRLEGVRSDRVMVVRRGADDLASIAVYRVVTPRR